MINADTKQYKGKTVAVSGGFDPLHVGHLDMFESAKVLVGEEGTLMVFVNTDDFLVNKKGRAFMSLEDRMRLIKAFSITDEVYAVIDTDSSVSKTLEQYKPDIFANGGDRTEENIPETDVCERLGIKMVFNVGGDKVRSSSELLNKYNKLV